MKVLILGASGATGKHAAIYLIEKKINIKILIRENSNILKKISDSPYTEIVRTDFRTLDDSKMKELAGDCSAVISCLGHNMSIKGIYGKPRNLVYSVIKNICSSVSTETKTRLILMSTIAYYDRKKEKRSHKERIILNILELLLPPHRDNVRTAEYLINEIGTNTNIEWAAVRPFTLITEENASSYAADEFPREGALSGNLKTSRINVGHFISELVTDNELWEKWKYKLPVIYNSEKE